MTCRSKIIVRYIFPLVTLLASSTLAEQDKTAKEPNDKASHSSASPITEKFPHTDHVKAARDHMVNLHQDFKRFPTRAEFVKHLEKEMNINTAQAEKILRDMDID